MRRHPIGTILATTLLLGLVPATGLASEPTDLFPHLAPGAEGPDVVRLQEALAAEGFFNHEVNGVYDERTASAVVAFHKYLRMKRTDEFSRVDWLMLHNLPGPALPYRPDATDYVEVDMSRQLLFVVRDGAISGILPVSTGGGHIYWSERNGYYARAATPVGDYTLRWNQAGWVCDDVTGWCVYKYWAFSDWYGIHGYHSVPTTPASHGCVRVTVWDADWIETQLFVGMSVHIWQEPPELPEEPKVILALGGIIG